MTISKNILAVAITAATLSATSVQARDWQGETKDAWIDGKVETSFLLNTELNNFKIDTDVESGRVILTGNVASETHSDLAEQIAHNIKGVTGVTNNLTIGDEVISDDSENRKFSTAFFDLTTTARLKSEYALSSELKAMDIQINTHEGKVTLEGKVATTAEKMLAEEIASGIDHVTYVNNNLQVGKS